MGNSRLSAALQAALQTVPVGLDALAADVGCSSSLLRHARAGTKTPSAALSRKIARAIRAQARQMDVCAARLDRVCGSTVTGRSP